MDEMTLQVLSEPEQTATSTSYTWLYRTGNNQALRYRKKEVGCSVIRQEEQLSAQLSIALWKPQRKMGEAHFIIFNIYLRNFPIWFTRAKKD